MTQDDLAYVDEIDCVIVTQPDLVVPEGEIGAVVLLLRLDPNLPSVVMVEFPSGQLINLKAEHCAIWNKMVDQSPPPEHAGDMTPREFSNQVNRAIRAECGLEPIRNGLFAIRGNLSGTVEFADQLRNTLTIEVGHGKLSVLIDYRDPANDRWIERDDTLLVEFALKIADA